MAGASGVYRSDNTPPGRPPRDRRSGRSRLPSSSRRQLFSPGERETAPTTSAAVETWSANESRALVEFILFYCDPNAWPDYGKKHKFWKELAEFVQLRAGTQIKRSVGACRLRVISKLPRLFSTPADAERHYCGVGAEPQELPAMAAVTATQNERVVTSEVGTQADLLLADASTQTKELEINLQPSSVQTQEDLIARQFCMLASESYGVHIHRNFIALSLRASKHLLECGRSNVLYGLAKALGRMRVDGSDSRLPAKRMPMGLLEHMVHFFNADSYSQIGKCPDDYRQWLTTMYCQFGNKWACLHLGPMWSVVSVEQGEAVSKSTNPMDARTNVPGPSSRTLRSYIAEGSMTTDAKIQTCVLDEAVKYNQDMWWWVKADGCDILPGVAESTKGIWSGDVDLGDGELQTQYKQYQCRLKAIKDLCFTNREIVLQQLLQHSSELQEDQEFLHTSLKHAQTTYEAKLKSSKTGTDKVLFKLAWQVKELQDLLLEVRNLWTEIASVICKCRDISCDLIKENVAHKLSTLRNKSEDVVKKLSKHRRTAASHIFVIMVSSERRDRKPYALPVQCIPIHGLKDKQAQDIADHVIAEMVKRNMKVAGFTTNGEFNSLRWRGRTRPLTILQIRSEARKMYQNKGLKTLMDMLTPCVLADGSIHAMKVNCAVPTEMLLEIFTWKKAGVKDAEIIDRLRQRTVPNGYDFHTWIPGKSETTLEKLKSILAQLQYTHDIMEWEKKGVPFRSHVYVPEIHPLTGVPFHEREDEAHVFKRIGQSLREGGPEGVRLERFLEAVKDSDTALSYHALIGTRKQSVSDVEQIFGAKVLCFFERKGYTTEADYVRTIRNWRRACDERGLTHLERKQYNKDFISYIMDELMPWHKDPARDFSHLEVNQDIKSIRGFTRETLSAVLVDIESREWRYEYCVANSISPEHPRASTTDDVECFFSVLRDMVGKDFTHKEVMFGWRKACEEFTKRLDPQLPFYYHTSHHQRFYEGERADFSQLPLRPQKEKRVARRELVTSNVGGRTVLAQHGARSIRMQFHNIPVELPPPPSIPSHSSDHSYFSHCP